MGKVRVIHGVLGMEAGDWVAYEDYKEQDAKLDRVMSKINRWQNQIDEGQKARNPVVQRARDEVLQMVINDLRKILVGGL